MKNKYYKYIFCILILLISPQFSYAEKIGYVFTYHGEFYEIDYDSLNILKEMKTPIMISSGQNIAYDMNSEKCFGSIRNLVVFDMNKFLIEKEIEHPQSYIYYEDIYINPQKNQIYLRAINGENKDVTIIYKSDDYSSTEIVEKIFRYYQFTQDGQYLFRIWGEDSNGKIIIEKRDTNNFGLIRTFNLPEVPIIDYIESFILSPDSKRLYVKGWLRQGDESPYHEIVIDADTGVLIQDLIIDVFPVIISSDGKYLYTLRRDDYPAGTLFLVKIDVNNFSREEILVGGGDIGGAILSLSPDGSILIIGSGTDRTEGQITVVDLIKKKTKGQLIIEYGVAAIYFK